MMYKEWHCVTIYKDDIISLHFICSLQEYTFREFCCLYLIMNLSAGDLFMKIMKKGFFAAPACAGLWGILPICKSVDHHHHYHHI